MTVIEQRLCGLGNPGVKIDYPHNHRFLLPLLWMLPSARHTFWPESGRTRPSSDGPTADAPRRSVNDQPQLLDFSHDVVGVAAGTEHIRHGSFHFKAPVPHILSGARPEFGVASTSNWNLQCTQRHRSGQQVRAPRWRRHWHGAVCTPPPRPPPEVPRGLTAVSVRAWRGAGGDQRLLYSRRSW